MRCYTIVRAARATHLGEGAVRIVLKGDERLDDSKRVLCRQAQPTLSGGSIAPMRRRISCCRLSNRVLGCAGLSTRGLMIAPARSAASAGPSAAALVWKYVRAAASAP